MKICTPIDKPFYLLRWQSFSFQLVSETVYSRLVKFSDFIFRGSGFWFPVYSWGKVSPQMILSEVGFRPPFHLFPGGWMVIDEIDGLKARKTFLNYWLSSLRFSTYCWTYQHTSFKYQLHKSTGHLESPSSQWNKWHNPWVPHMVSEGTVQL